MKTIDYTAVVLTSGIAVGTWLSWGTTTYVNWCSQQFKTKQRLEWAEEDRRTMLAEHETRITILEQAGINGE